MKKLLMFVGLAAASSIPAFATLTQCATGNDASGVTNGTQLALTGTCSVDGSTFSNFTVVAASGFGGGGLTGLSVTVYTDSTNPNNLVFNTTNLGSADIQVYFQAAPGLNFVSLNQEGDTVTETVCKSSITVGTESCTGGVGNQLALLNSGNTSSSISVVPTDYFVKDVSGSSQFIEGFGSSVPEPMTLSLMGAGLLGLGLLKRKIRK